MVKRTFLKNTPKICEMLGIIFSRQRELLSTSSTGLAMCLETVRVICDHTNASRTPLNSLMVVWRLHLENSWTQLPIIIPDDVGLLPEAFG